MTWAERDLRRLAVLPAIALLLLVPIGFFLGGASQITLFLCRIDGFRIGTGALCGSAFMRALTAILPPLLLSLWNGVVLPKLLYWLALAEGRSASLSALDRRVCDVYFLFDVVNVFLGTVLGGSLFNSLRTLLQSPGSVLRTLGAAAPTVSSFWMNFLVLQAAALVPSRFLFPHPGVLGDLWRAARAGFRRFGAWVRGGCCWGGGGGGGGRKRSRSGNGGGGGRRSSGGAGSSPRHHPPPPPPRSPSPPPSPLGPRLHGRPLAPLHPLRQGDRRGAPHLRRRAELRAALAARACGRRLLLSGLVAVVEVLGPLRLREGVRERGEAVPARREGGALGERISEDERERERERE